MPPLRIILLGLDASARARASATIRASGVAVPVAEAPFDAAYVGGTPRRQAALAADVATAGRHVLLAKPGVAVPAPPGVVVMTAFEQPHHPAHVALRDLVVHGALGDLERIRLDVPAGMHGEARHLAAVLAPGLAPEIRTGPRRITIAGSAATATAHATFGTDRGGRLVVRDAVRGHDREVAVDPVATATGALLEDFAAAVRAAEAGAGSSRRRRGARRAAVIG